MPLKLVRSSTLLPIALIFLLSSLAFGQVAQPNRIVRAVDNRSVVRLQGTLNPRARAEFDQGPASPTLRMQRMTLFFQPTAEQQTALNQLLAEQQDPSSVNYHKWLTPEEFGDRFGISQQDINTLTAWLQFAGFHGRPSRAQPHLDCLQRYRSPGQRRLPDLHSQLSGERQNALRSRDRTLDPRRLCRRGHGHRRPARLCASCAQHQEPSRGLPLRSPATTFLRPAISAPFTICLTT